MAEASGNDKEMKQFMGAEPPLPSFRKRQLQCIDHTSQSVNNSSSQQPSEPYGRHPRHDLRPGKNAYPAHSDIQHRRNPLRTADPEKFKQHVHDMLEAVKDKSSEHKIIFLDSWNEWGEGNYMEPDLKYGHAFLEALKSEIVEP